MAVAKSIDIHSEESMLGQNIRRIRTLRGLSQGQLGDLVDMDRAAISNYENGAKGEMGFRMLRRFAHALRVSPAVLTGDEEFCGGGDCGSDEEELSGILSEMNEENRTVVMRIARALLLEQAAGSK